MKKDFFRLNSLKAIIAIVVFVLLIFIPIMPCKIGNLFTGYEWNVCPANPSLGFYQSYFGGAIGADIQYLGVGGIFGFILAFIISLIISYLIACLLSLVIKKK